LGGLERRKGGTRSVGVYIIINMALTAEQRKRMEENRKRALEVKRKKQIEKEKNEKATMASSASTATNVFEAGGFVGKSLSDKNDESHSKKRRMNDGSDDGKAADKKKSCNGGTMGGASKNVISSGNTNEGDHDDESSLEDFELDCSPYISQTEAQRTYCVPKGTLEVCAYIEKDNPRNRGFSKMKLYDRGEVRQRARKRFGGKAGLTEERDRRRKKRFEKDLEEVKDVFG